MAVEIDMTNIGSNGSTAAPAAVAASIINETKQLYNNTNNNNTNNNVKSKTPNNNNNNNNCNHSASESSFNNNIQDEYYPDETTTMTKDIKYNLVLQKHMTEEHYEKLAGLFTEYGVWTATGKNTKLTPARLRQWYLFDENCGAVIATCHKGNHLGQALFRRFSVPSAGTGNTASSAQVEAIWISQLLVSREHRQKGIAKSMLKHSLDKLDWQMAGIASCNPYAIKSLERATNSKTDAQHNLRHSNIMQHCGVPYIVKAPIVPTTPNHLYYIDTNFHIDTDHIPEILTREMSRGNWHLGNYLPRGFEFLSIILKK
ncbi:hypothetical protein DFA_02600 [Cavenderia fasciculata]|uniref:N-acetyltransferase domain-containing protein n=1 Tax=Cavenderia fasciculata TaxID=261658 RepID=F4PZU7_CACFS|nr:uncharacterized protein DFA_02600 [Cavenderia fasciculata]EGG18861.1 hypothetical protein DFA_02600 [Cavenderia fasciculata]|eukprot:XP_004357323.1 hypothetical protein DFA_02600 [Cavenderia fasciculata]